MKKIFFSLILMGCSIQFSFSQTLKLCDLNNQTVNSGDTIEIDSLPSVEVMTIYMKVINLSTSDVTLNCEKSYCSVVPGTSDEFCFANSCYPPATMVSNNQLIAAGDTNSGFSSSYTPSNQEGITLIKYLFKIIHGDEAWFYAKFNGTLGIKEHKLISSISKPYPNPAKDMVNIDYNLTENEKSTLQIVNVIGKLEKQDEINNLSGKVSMNVSDLPSGIYFCVFNMNGKTVKTQKIIISH